MATRERRTDAADQRARRLIVEVGRELREARLAAGLSQVVVASAGRRSDTLLSRIERGRLDGVTVADLCRIGSALGLELVVRFYPVGDPVRDAAHAALLTRLRSRLHPSLGWRTEVPLPIPGDRRAWDAVIRGPGFVVGVEAETRLADSQALARKLALKRRDGRVDRVVLLVADTARNRAALAAVRESLRADLPDDTRRMLAGLARPDGPDASGIVVL